MWPPSPQEGGHMSKPYDFIPGGLVIEDLIIGRGATANAGDDVVVHYVGKLANGQQFDSSRNRRDPLDFALGAGDVDKGCGGVIPPNATLVFDVELLEVS